ncbi:MAG: nucleotidyltransferase family protein [Firmicutes bacterium]|nr:nucleotidyltransferase family protein [Bacillota bacterium]
MKPAIESRYKARELALFGSFARGEQDRQSDVDLLVEFTPEADLLDMVGLAQFLEERLQRAVDVVPKASLRAEIRDSVLSEAIPV